MAQIRRMLLLAVMAALLVAGSAGSAAGKHPPKQPTLIVREGCQYLFDGLYGGQLDVVGLEPNTRYFFYYVGIGGSSFTTDEHGGIRGRWRRRFLGALRTDGTNLERRPWQPIDCSSRAHRVYATVYGFPGRFRPPSRSARRAVGGVSVGSRTRGSAFASSRDNARQDCHAERDAMGREAFREKYGKGKQHRRAMHRCVRQVVGTG